MLRHIFPIPRTLPIMSGTARAWWYSLWIHEDAVGRGFPKLIHLGWWIFPTLAFQNRFMRPDIHGHQTKIFTFRTCHGPAWFLICFLLLDCGWWGMKGCSMVRDVDFGSFRPPAAIISLGSRWLHVVDFTTFVGAVHQLKARSRDASRTWDLSMGWMLGTHPMVILPRSVMFSAMINRNPYIWTFPWGIIRVPGKDYRQPDGIVPPACPAERAEALADVVPSKQNRDWQADLCLKMLRK